MNNQVEVRIGYRDDEKIVGELVKFFEPVAAPRVTRREETARKTWVAPITIILSIVGEWAAERYILDPLADRAEEWWKAIVSTWRRSKSKRRFNVTVQFDSDTNALEMEVSDVSDEETLKQVWSHVRRAHQISHDARERGTLLSKVRILPDGMQGLLVIGYERNRPRYVIDMRSGALQPIEPSADKIHQIVSRFASSQSVSYAAECLALVPTDPVWLTRDHGTTEPGWTDRTDGCRIASLLWIRRPKGLAVTRDPEAAL
ncbi:MAG: hypothetical protein PVJ55_10555 [Anaerolineae bacterium]|jgi:hypothetical protein